MLKLIAFLSDVGQSLGKSYEILREAANEMKSIIERRFDQVILLLFSLLFSARDQSYIHNLTFIIEAVLIK